MQLIKPSYEIIFIQNNILQLIEKAGRTCYKSEDKITNSSAENFVTRIIKSGHHSVIEHGNITIKFICDRGVSHELVRHRLASFSQESTRYCNYKSNLTFVIPPWVSIKEGWYDDILIPSILDKAYDFQWFVAMQNASVSYKRLIEKWSPQQARSVLPNSLKTEVVMTANIREFRHVLNLRCSKAAHPQIRETMIPCLKGIHERNPILFDDLIDKYCMEGERFQD